MRRVASGRPMFLHSWLLFPLVLAVVCFGGGLLLERLAAPAIPRVLVLPLGMAVVVVVSALFTYLDATAELAAPAVVLVAVAGLGLGRRELRAWLRPTGSAIWPALAGLLPLAAVAAPVVLTGRPGFTGYARIVDLAFQVDFAAYLQDAGRSAPDPSSSSFLTVVDKMVAVHYPGGAQSALGAVASLAGLDPLWAWQPFVAAIAGCLGLALFDVLRTAVPFAPVRALAAGIAAQATVLYAYALVAGIKELSAAAMLALVAALLVAHRPGDGPLRQVVPVSVAMAAALGVINVGIVPWLGILAAVFFVVELTRRRASRLRVITNWAVLTALAAVLSLPAVLGSLTIATIAVAGGPGGLGNLAEAMPVWSSAGVWLTRDYRFPLSVSGYEGATYVLVAVVLGFAALGFVRALISRDWGLVGLGAAAAIAVGYIVARAEPWSEFKAFSITAPLTLSLAFAGAAGLWPGPGQRGRSRVVGLSAALIVGSAIALGVLAGNALTYHGTSLAPSDSMADLQRIGERYAGRGPALYPVFDEYGDHLLREVRANGLVNPVGGVTGLRGDALPGLQFVRDVDEYQLAFLKRYRLLVLRRDPTASRPPSDWRRVQRTRFFDVWQRSATPSVVTHMPLRLPGDQRSARFCDGVSRALTRAGAGARVSYVAGPAVQQYDVPPDIAPRNWERRGPVYVAAGPGRVDIGVKPQQPGRFDVFVRGSFGRGVSVTVDGRTLRTVRWQESYPGLYVPFGAVDLAARVHAVSVLRGGGGLLPGTGNDVGTSGELGTIGPVAFAPRSQPAAQTVGRAKAMSVCRGDLPLDWMEIVRPRS